MIRRNEPNLINSFYFVMDIVLGAVEVNSERCTACVLSGAKSHWILGVKFVGAVDVSVVVCMK